MKKLINLSGLFVAIVLAGVVMFSCLSELFEPNEIKLESYLTAEEMFASLFDGSHDGAVIILPSSNKQEFVVYAIDHLRYTAPIVKTRAEPGQGGWTTWGKVCGMGSAVKFNNAMQEQYEGRCYEMRASEPDEDGCRMMSHRSCQ